jgi:hypothetical protein
VSETIAVAEQMHRYSSLLDKGLAALRDASRMLCEHEETYREAVKDAWAEAPDGTVPEREAWVKGITASVRRKRDEADLARQDALEAIRSRRTQISALQSLLAAEREEAGLIRAMQDVTS